jgi:hypothetical protein
MNEYRVQPLRYQKVPIEVRVNWQTIGALARTNEDGQKRRFWHRPVETTLTLKDYSNDQDTLFTLLNKCLPFAQWDHVDYTTLDYDAYDVNTGHRDASFGERLYADVLQDGNGEAEMREVLQDVLSFDMLGYLSDRVSTRKWLFVLYCRESNE